MHKTISKHEEILNGKQLYWYKNNVLERRIANVTLNNLLCFHELQMKYVGTYKDLVNKLYVSQFNTPIPVQ